MDTFPDTGGSPNDPGWARATDRLPRTEPGRSALPVPATEAVLSSEAPQPVQAGGVGGHRRRRRVRNAAILGFVVVVVVGVTVAAVGIGGGDTGTPSRSALPPTTTKVTRATLTETQNVDGTLGYGDTTAVAARGAGTITWLPAAGTTLQQGKTVYTADNLPVVLLYGSLPLYRTLTDGVKGPDVKEFEENLAALGYTGFTVDEEYTSATATAVKKWQKALGRTQTGTVEPGQVVLAAGPVRVTDQKAHVGDPAGGPVLTYTATTRLVTVALDVAKQQLVKQGTDVTVTLPGDKTVKGTVSSVGSVAHAGSSGSATTIDVVVSVADQSALGTLDQAPVQVALVSNERKDVLTVPVAALLALAEGGYGVQVVEGSGTRIVAVQVGLFAGGRVEVSGTGIDAGVVVGMPT
jgi:peptidoglycan hydrolase-like protein with peptidoglycan-binding domain